MNAYGYLRFTKDIHLVIELVPENIVGAFAALNTLGYRPNVPITGQQFSDPNKRRSWVKEKQMKVLQFWSDQHRETPVDVFIDVPFEFEAELAAATRKELQGIGTIARTSTRARSGPASPACVARSCLTNPPALREQNAARCCRIRLRSDCGLGSVRTSDIHFFLSADFVIFPFSMIRAGWLIDLSPIFVLGRATLIQIGFFHAFFD